MKSMTGDQNASSTKTVDGAHGKAGPAGDPIGDTSGNANQPNQLQPNDAIRVTPKPDEELQASQTSDPSAQWTGERPGGEAPPPNAKTH
jgi:hypothetical protein